METGPAEFVIASLPPLITAAIAALGLWLSERRKDRDDAQRRLKAIGQETAHLSYLRSWLKTQQLAAGAHSADVERARQEVSAELVSSRERLSRAFMDAPEPDAPSALLRAWRKAALVPLVRPAARAVAWFYRFFVVLAVLMIPMGITTDYSEEISFGFALFIGIFVALPFLAVALGFRGWAMLLERRARTAAMPVVGMAHPQSWHQSGPSPNVQANPFSQ